MIMQPFYLWDLNMLRTLVPSAENLFAFLSLFLFVPFKCSNWSNSSFDTSPTTLSSRRTWFDGTRQRFAMLCACCVFKNHLLCRRISRNSTIFLRSTQVTAKVCELWQLSFLVTNFGERFRKLDCEGLLAHAGNKNLQLYLLFQYVHGMSKAQFDRWLFYFNEWSGTGLNKERRKKEDNSNFAIWYFQKNPI